MILHLKQLIVEFIKSKIRPYHQQMEWLVGEVVSCVSRCGGDTRHTFRILLQSQSASRVDFSTASAPTGNPDDVV